MSHYDCPCMEKCPLHYAMSVIGGKWKVQIVCALTNAGALRYNALRAKLDGISNTVLATSLRELEADGLVVRTVYPEVPVRVEYRPTEDCRALLPILEQLSDWAEARMAAAQLLYFFAWLALLDAKQAFPVLHGQSGQFLRGHALDLGQLFRDVEHIAGVVALAPQRDGRHIGGVRLDQDTVEGNHLRHLHGFAGVLVGDRAVEA